MCFSWPHSHAQHLGLEHVLIISDLGWIWEIEFSSPLPTLLFHPLVPHLYTFNLHIEVPHRAMDLGGGTSNSFIRKFKDTVTKISKLCLEDQLVDMELNLFKLFFIWRAKAVL